jgi:pyruvate/2-oxoglutarate/acetoin dehydrogenase E1 component/TPP-dependent pyruvate/acetoin dehydrogenase alpha subunit
VIPDLGATGSDLIVENWLAKEGDFVEAGQPLLSVLTDKASVDIEAFRAGYLRRIVVPEGYPAPIGTVVAYLADAMDEPLEPGAATNVPPLADFRLTKTRQVSEKPSPVAATPVRQKETTAEIEEEADLPLSLVLGMFRSMTLIRRFEDYLYQLFLQGLVPGTLHQYQGQEAVAVGVCAALRPDDLIFSTHRPVGHLLAKGCPPRSIAAEIWGKATGCVAGKGGQMHLADISIGAPPSNAIVGANIPIATGAALGFKLRGLDRVAVSFFGEGAANIGAAHEGINFAAVKDAPVLFVCENNLYGASTHQSLAMRIEDVATRADGYGIPGLVVDGMDVLAVYHAAVRAVRRARQGKGPTLLECKTYRYQGHSRGDPGGYRSNEELAHWKARDPVPAFRGFLLDEYDVEDDFLARIEEECQQEAEEAVAFARSSPEPAPPAVMEQVFAPRNQVKNSGQAPLHARPSQRMSMTEALRDALRIAMRSNPAVFVLGEDVGISGGFGGGFTVTLGLSDEFGHDRVMDTPISEIAIVGAGVGAALTGMRPVVEMQYGDFVFCAMDQVVNQAAKMHYMSNGQVAVPLVLRLPGGASGRGCQHGQSTEAFFLHTPGLKVVCPSNPYDAKGLLLAAIRDGNPVVFLEHKLLYGARGGRKEKTSLDPFMEVPLDDYEVEIGTVAVRREGDDLTILANMLMLHRALAAGEELAAEGISAEVIDMRSLVPLDLDPVVSSVRKTRRVLIVEEDNLTGGWGAEIAARLYEEAFTSLAAPIQRLAAPDTPLPAAPVLENAYVPSSSRIMEAARCLCRTVPPG